MNSFHPSIFISEGEEVRITLKRDKGVITADVSYISRMDNGRNIPTDNYIFLRDSDGGGVFLLRGPR